MTSRDLVKKTLEFENKNHRVPRDLWTLPWSWERHGDMLRKIQNDFPSDIVGAPNPLRTPTIAQGDQYTVGNYTDEWGCRFVNIQQGIVGEAKEPIVEDDDWDDWENVHIPVELLSFDVDEANAFCKSTDKFVLGGYWPCPFQQMQYIRTPANLFMDLVDPPKNMLKFMDKMFAFYYELMEKWAKTDIDALPMADDWGSQNTLLINPNTWEQYFKPFYKEIIDIAHRHGKKAFMHSDGHILQILPSLIDLGLDAVNSQLFCMGLENMGQFKGKITFWGEIDRQHTLSRGSLQDVQNAVKDVREHLWDNGGCIALCEFGVGAKGENVYEMYKTWDSFK